MEETAQARIRMTAPAMLDYGTRHVPYHHVIRVDYDLTAVQLAALRQLAEQRGLSAAELVHLTLDGVLRGADANIC
jgi:hypothetical protein